MEMARINKKALMLATVILVSVLSVPIVLVTADEPSGVTRYIPPWSSNTAIQAAINTANPGARIEVDDGIYNWFVVPWWKPGLQIVAVGDTTIAGPGPTPGFIGVTIFADDTLLQGFTVSSYAVGIAVFSDRCIIENNNVAGNWFLGIAIVNGDDNLVRNNWVHDASPGFQGIWCGGLPGAPSAITSDMSDSEMREVARDALVVVEDLYAHEPVRVYDETGYTDVDYMLPDPAETEYRLPLDEEEIESTFGGDSPMSKFFVEDNRFINNEVQGYFIGIHMAWFTAGSAVRGNNVHDCFVGILVGPIAWKAYITKNIVHTNLWGIVVFLNVYDVYLRLNTVAANSIGIALLMVTDVDVIRNDVMFNGQGIIVFGIPFGPLWSYDIVLKNNEVHDNFGNGIWIFGCYDFVVRKSRVYSNGAHGIIALLSMNGKIGGRKWYLKNMVYDNGGDGIAVVVSNEIIVKKNRVYDNSGFQLYWFQWPSGTPAPLWIEPGRNRFIKNKDNLGNLLVPVILSP